MMVEGHIGLPGYAFFGSGQASEAASQHTHPQRPCGSPLCVGQQPEVKREGASAGHTPTTCESGHYMG